MRNTTIVTLLAGAVAAVAVLAGCGAADGAPGAAPVTHNAADVRFAQDMIPHHRQAVEMAGLVAGRTANPAVVDLAARIGAAQGPEIDTMTGWLQEWGAEVPAAGTSGMEGMSGTEGMDHGGDPAAMDGMHAMDGMMTPEQMGSLEQADGPAFDRLFLEQMIAHHTGAVEMATVELEEGADPDALALARTVVDTQQAEIDEMAALLAQG